MKKKTYLLNFMLLFLSLAVCFIIAEIGLRSFLFNNVPFLDDIPVLAEQRNPRYYADSRSEEDFHRLKCHLSKILNKKLCGMKQVHPLLGWVGHFSSVSYLHDKTELVNSRRPVLLYGDSFAHCIGGESCFQDILNTDKEFTKDHYLLNYGVTAYGLDQIYLLFQKSVDHYDRPFVVLSFMTEDLDRSTLSFFGSQKPSFRIINNALELDKPKMINPNDFYLKYPPQITSYLYRRILHSKFSKDYLPDSFVSFLKRDEYYIQKKTRLNEKIILEIIKELRVRELDFVFLIFHHGGDLLKDDWRDAFIKRIMDENKVPYIWSKKLLVERHKGKDAQLFIPGDGHPAAPYNKIIAEEIKRHVLSAPTTTHPLSMIHIQEQASPMKMHPSASSPELL